MNSLAIPIAFCLMSVLLLWFVIGSKGNWLIKAFATFFCVYFSVVIWFSLYTYLGWPCKENLPYKYAVYWAEIDEPSPVSEGAIYLWVVELESKKTTNFFYSLKYLNRKDEPRIYEIPYSRNLHKNIQDMMENIKKGSVYIGGEKDNFGENSTELNPLKNKGQFGFSHQSKDQYLYPLPSPKIPEKILK